MNLKLKQMTAIRWPQFLYVKPIRMTARAIVLVLVTLLTGISAGPDAIVRPLLTKDLTGFAGKEGMMFTVEYPPGAEDPVHRHNAHGFIYVLEGSIVMQVRGENAVTLTPGQTYYEGPNDVHVVGRNASSTKAAKFLVFLVKDKNAPILIPER